MDEDGEGRIHLRVESGESVHLEPGRYRVSVVIPEHLRRPNLAAFWCGEPAKITYREV